MVNPLRVSTANFSKNLTWIFQRAAPKRGNYIDLPFSVCEGRRSHEIGHEGVAQLIKADLNQSINHSELGSSAFT